MACVVLIVPPNVRAIIRLFSLTILKVAKTNNHPTSVIHMGYKWPSYFIQQVMFFLNTTLSLLNPALSNINRTFYDKHLYFPVLVIVRGSFDAVGTNEQRFMGLLSKEYPNLRIVDRSRCQPVTL
jgi:hypothetical protein